MRAPFATAGRKSRPEPASALRPQAPGTRADIPGTLSTGAVMKRLLALVLCAVALGAAVTSCGGTDFDNSTDKLTIVGAGS
jgi:hypothetical protein